MSVKASASIPFILLIVSVSSQAALGGIAERKYYATDGPQLVALDSSGAQVVRAAKSKMACLFECEKIGCFAVSFAQRDRACEMILAGQALSSSVESGLPIVKMLMVLGFEVGAKVWRAEDSLSRVGPSVTIDSVATGRNGSTQSVVIGTTGCYLIEAAGARGGGNTFTSTAGGQGARVSARANLTAGTRLTVVVGQMGGSTSIQLVGGGGGGGSFVYRSSDQLLLLAAGGGGGASTFTNGRPGEVGVNGSDSLGSNSALSGLGGADGQPGFNNPGSTPATSSHGGCGAGWLGKAVNPRRSSSDGERGGSLADGWAGGVAGGGSSSDGGFGGGGGGGFQSSSGKGTPGAGGGFSGGGAGLNYGHIGGGGGSFCLGGCVSDGSWTGDQGFVSFRLASTSETCG